MTCLKGRQQKPPLCLEEKKVFNSREYVNSIKERFPEGTHIVLDYMCDDPRPIEPGTKGVVLHVDDIGTVHCIFETEGSLAWFRERTHFTSFLPKTEGKQGRVVLEEEKEND